MKNTMGYSDEWQTYKGDYDKFEYDIKLKTGEIIENCYPNANKFNKLDVPDKYHAKDVSEIRFSNNPVTGLNNEVSQFKTKE